MKKIFIIFILLLLSIPVYAAGVYVRDGGTGDGSAWDNALDDIPATITRGDTIYIADGNYCPSGYDFNDVESSTTWIYIIKATASNHGVDTGWSSTYGDGQAVFTEQVDFITGYYEFNGMTRSTDWSDTTSYGFRVVPDGVGEDHFIGPTGYGHSASQVDNIIIKYVAMTCLGEGDGSNGQFCIYSNPSVIIDSLITVSYCYMGNGSSNMLFRRWKSSTISDNYFYKNWSSAANHGQQISPGFVCDDITLKNNVFIDSEIFVVGFHNTGGDSTTASYRWKIYNNIVNGSTGNISLWAQAENTVKDSWMGNEFHHNTVMNITGAGRGTIYVGIFNYLIGDRESYSYNNLYYNCTNVAWNSYDGDDGAIIHDYDAFYDCTFLSGTGYDYADSIGVNSITGAGDPLEDDYTLSAGATAIDAGKSDLGSPFDTDRAGNTRSGSWDMGVYEYQTPATPSTVVNIGFGGTGTGVIYKATGTKTVINANFGHN